MKSFTLLSIICSALFFMSCGDDPIVGCMDPVATNYNSLADEDSGDCQYKTGCMDPEAANYDETAIVDSGDCRFPGCTDEDGDTYDPKFNEDDGSCTYFDRYLGDYDGVFVCAGVFLGLLDQASSTITKKAGDDNKDQVIVFVSNPASEITLVLDGTITKDDVTIDTYIPEFEFTIDLGGGNIIEGPFEVYVTGKLVRMDDNSLSGDININIIKDALSVNDICTYTATKI